MRLAREQTCYEVGLVVLLGFGLWAVGCGLWAHDINKSAGSQCV